MSDRIGKKMWRDMTGESLESLRLRGSELHKWLFSKMDGREMKFTQQGMPFKVLHSGARVGGTVTIGENPCKVWLVRRSEAEKGKRIEVRFPYKMYRRVEEGDEEPTSDLIPVEESTLVGYMEVRGNFKQGTGRCVFHPVEGKGTAVA